MDRLETMQAFITVADHKGFAAAARRLRMTTLGFLQFLAPMLQVAVAVGLMGEQFTVAYQRSFPLIWAAVGLYLADAVVSRRRAAAKDV